MSSRPSWTVKERAEIFRDANGVCHICGVKIQTWQNWHVEHPKARGFKGSDKKADMRPAHIDCHQVKTNYENRLMRKADAQMKAGLGLQRKASRPIPGSKRSAFKKSFSGEVSRR